MAIVLLGSSHAKYSCTNVSQCGTSITDGTYLAHSFSQSPTVSMVPNLLCQFLVLVSPFHGHFPRQALPSPQSHHCGLDRRIFCFGATTPRSCGDGREARVQGICVFSGVEQVWLAHTVPVNEHNLHMEIFGHTSLFSVDRERMRALVVASVGGRAAAAHRTTYRRITCAWISL